MSGAKTLRQSHEVLRDALGHGEAVRLALYLGTGSSVSEWVVQSWLRAPGVSGSTDTGRRSPLELLVQICDFLERELGGGASWPIADHVAQTCGGAFVPLPQVTPKADSEAVEHMSASLKEAGEFVEKLRSSWFDTSPGRIDAWFELPALLMEGEEAVVAILAALEFAKRKAEEGER